MIKWPQPAFAHELGLTKDQLASIEYVRTPLRYEVGYRLCYMLDVNQEWLANGRGPVTPFTRQGGAPLPNSVPKKMLFSDVFADALRGSSKLCSDVEIQTKSACGRAEPVSRKLTPPDNFDLTAWLMTRILETVERERMVDPSERYEFALDVAHLLNVVVLKTRRRRNAKTIRKAGGFKPFRDIHNPDLSKKPVDCAKKILELREQIGDLEGEMMTLEEELAFKSQPQTPAPSDNTSRRTGPAKK